MTSDPLRNNVDDSFIEELNQHISNEAVSILIQDYIKNAIKREERKYKKIKEYG